MALSVGNRAPQFKAKDGDGKTVKLADFKGRKVVLYFYPRDMTPGCTKEACAFQEDLTEFTRREVVVLGVSTDDSISHRKFADKYHLAFPLLADTDRAIAEAYGVWQEKNMYGRKIWGVKRQTFVIDEQGRIAHIFDKVKPEVHSREVLCVLDALGKK